MQTSALTLDRAYYHSLQDRHTFHQDCHQLRLDIICGRNSRKIRERGFTQFRAGGGLADNCAVYHWYFGH